MAWFRKTKKGLPDERARSKVPEGLWVKCEGCREVIYAKELERNLRICPKCGFHFRIDSHERIRLLVDEAEPARLFAEIRPADPLGFKDAKPYSQRLSDYQKKLGMADAIQVVEGHIDGVAAILAVLEYGFMGGSMGSVVGEVIARSAERALERRQPLVVVSASGGARMQEGALSLMQMGKIAAALARLREARLPYLSVLTDPDDRRRHGLVRHARRPQHRRARGADRLRRAAGHPADDPAGAARGLPAQRVPPRARLPRPGGQALRAQGDDLPVSAPSAAPEPAARPA